MISYIFFLLCVIRIDLARAYKSMKYVGKEYCSGDTQVKCTAWNSDYFYMTHSGNKRTCLEYCQRSGYNSYVYSNSNSQGYCERGARYAGYSSNGKKCGSGGGYGSKRTWSSSWWKYQSYCPGGKYNSGYTSCKSCIAGRYNPWEDFQNSGCYACPAGKYQNQNGQKSCKSCPLAQYQSQSGQKWCHWCPAAKYNYRTARPTCDSCWGGKYGTVARQLYWQNACKNCQIGKYQDQNAKTSCKTCQVGFYNSQSGRSDCRSCPAGKYQNQNGQNTCNSCAAGFYNSQIQRTSCLTCPKGYISKGSGYSSCQFCPEGEFQNVDGQSTCKKCPSGFHRHEKVSVDCAACPAGQSSEIGAENCCSSGTYSLISRVSEGVATCHVCAPGYYAPSDTVFQPQSDLASVQTTSKHYPDTIDDSNDAVPTHFVECVQCESDTYQDESGQTSCKQCPSGKFTNPYGVMGTEDSTWASNLCRSSTEFGVCEPGEFDEGDDDCMLTDIGTFAPMWGAFEGVGVMNCLGANYQDEAGQSSCKQCPIGYYGKAGTSPPANSECSMCPIGKWSNMYFETNPSLRTSFQYLGAGECRGVGGLSPAWSVKSSANHVDAREKCLDDETCVAYTRLQDGKFKYFCSEEGGFCDQSADESNAYTTIVGDFTPFSVGLHNYFLISSGTCASHDAVQVTEEVECQTARDYLGGSQKYWSTGHYTPGTRPKCFVYTNYPNRIYYNTNTGWTETYAPIDSTNGAQVVCKQTCPTGYILNEDNQLCEVDLSYDLGFQMGTMVCYGIERRMTDVVIGCKINEYTDVAFQKKANLKTCGNWLGIPSNTPSDWIFTTFLPSAVLTTELAIAAGAEEQRICRECPKGYFSNTVPAVRRSECRKCPSGYFSSIDGANSCDACPVGTYSSEVGAIESETCKNCPGGYFQDESGQNGFSDCTTCAEGRFSPYESAPNIFTCILCPHGFYSSESGSMLCEKCSDTSITDDVGSVDDTYCKECPIGKFNMQSEKCIECPKGWFKDSGTCSECPVGKMSRVHDADECEDCDYQDESGRETCKICPTSSYVKNNACLECPQGKFAETFNAVTCVSCPDGRYAGTKPMDSVSNCVRCPSVSSGCYGSLIHIDQNTARKSVEVLCEEAARAVYGITDNFETRNTVSDPYGCFVEDRVRAVLNLNQGAPKTFDHANHLGLCQLNGQSVAARTGTCSGMIGGPTQLVSDNQLFGGAVFTISSQVSSIVLDWHPLFSVSTGDACPMGQHGVAPSCTDCPIGKYNRVFETTSSKTLKNYMEASRIGVDVSKYMYGSNTVSATSVNFITDTNDVWASVPQINWEGKSNGWVTHSVSQSDYKYSTFDWTLTQCLDMCQQDSSCSAASWAPSVIEQDFVDKHKDAAEIWSINTFRVRGGDSISLINSVNLGWSGCSSSKKCSECQGDCDYNQDCKDGLECYHRGGDEAVPGCTNNMDSDVDYCYDPKKTGWSPGWSHGSWGETSTRSWGAPAYINDEPNVFHSVDGATQFTRVHKRLDDFLREQQPDGNDIIELDVPNLDNDWWNHVHVTGKEPVDEWLNLDRHINNVLPDGTYSNYMVPRIFFAGENLEPTFLDSSGTRESLEPKYGTCLLSKNKLTNDLVHLVYQEDTATGITATIQGLEPDMRYAVEWDVLMSGPSADAKIVDSVILNGQPMGGCNPSTNASSCDFTPCLYNVATLPYVTTNSEGEIAVISTILVESSECGCDRSVHYGKCVRNAIAEVTYIGTKAALRFRLRPVDADEVNPGFWLSCQRYGQSVLVDDEAGLSCRAHLVHTYMKEQCTSCPAGKFAKDVASTICKNCPQGWHSEIGSYRCTQCPMCPPGKIESSSKCQCEFCPSGQVPLLSTNKTVCEMCKPGKYAMPGAVECKECAPGKKAPNAGTGRPCESCRCDIGKKINSLVEHNDRTNCNEIQCQSCASGYYQDIINHLTECKPCGPHNWQYQTGQNSCYNCAGCNQGYTRRQLAKVSSSACSGSDSCSACAKGHYCSVDDNVERECPRGRYQNEAAKTSCKECPVGKYSGVGKTECTQCDAGKSSKSGSGYMEHCINEVT